mmetsp:Transcript_15376/g.35411  ORF Transcript_15376/g.35411 Transcript_15376/m.35411 type:complete len:149 (-) Transcript_15376:963-1409(-)
MASTARLSISLRANVFREGLSLGSFVDARQVLDVGSGSGYLTAAMATMVGETGQAIGIDHVPDLVAWSVENIHRDGKGALLESGQLQLQVADGFGGLAEAAPFDCIHVGAAPVRVPPALKEQLKPGGVLLLPVGPPLDQAFVRITRCG